MVAWPITWREALDLRLLRWVLLGLYALLLGTLGLVVLSADLGFVLTVATVYLVSQAILVGMPASMTLDRPLRRGKAWLPAVIAATMLALLLGGVGMAIMELVYLDDNAAVGYALLGVVVISWFCWAVVLTRQWMQRPVYLAMRRQTGLLAAGSLGELVIACSAHAIVSRRPGCLVGLSTAMGIAAGLAVLIITLGPAIALLFLRQRYRTLVNQGVRCATCDYDLRGSPGPTCPECGTPIPR